jgi:hypothetical protein
MKQDKELLRQMRRTIVSGNTLQRHVHLMKLGQSNGAKMRDAVYKLMCSRSRA